MMEKSGHDTPRPRVWTAFGVLVLCTVAVLLVQVVAAVLLVAYLIATGTPAETVEPALEAVSAGPLGLVTKGVLTQLFFGAIVLAAAAASPIPVPQRLSLGRPRLAWWGVLAVLGGTLLPALVGVTLGEFIAGPDPADAAAYAAMTGAWPVVFVLAFSLLPGLFEEFVFRGYVQGRLLRRWSPWLAIPVTSLMFAVFHLSASGIVATLLLGLWWGVIAWRSRSVWPGVLSHIACNLVFHSQVFVTRTVTVPNWVLWAAWVVAVPLFAIGVFALWRAQSPDPAAGSAPPD